MRSSVVVTTSVFVGHARAARTHTVAQSGVVGVGVTYLPGIHYMRDYDAARVDPATIPG